MVTGKLSKNQLVDFAAEMRESLSQNACETRQTESILQFGSVWFGAIKDFWASKPHPFVIVSKYSGCVPPNMKLRASTSKRQTGPGILCLPERAIHLKKDGERYVRSYVLCYLKLQQTTKHIREKFRFLNNLDEEYHEPLKRCLSEVRRRANAR